MQNIITADAAVVRRPHLQGGGSLSGSARGRPYLVSVDTVVISPRKFFTSTITTNIYRIKISYKEFYKIVKNIITADAAVVRGPYLQGGGSLSGSARSRPYQRCSSRPGGVASCPDGYLRRSNSYHRTRCRGGLRDSLHVCRASARCGPIVPL